MSVSSESNALANEILEPLIELASSAEWGSATVCAIGDCVIGTLESSALVPTASAFRFGFDVAASVEAIAHVLSDEMHFRACDPSLEHFDVLEHHCGYDVVYMAHKEQSWLETPHDYYVVMASTLLKSPVDNRRCVFPDRDPDQSKAPVAFVLSCKSCSAPESAAPPCDGSVYVRGQVHFYGYVAYEVSSDPVRSHVEHFVCMDPDAGLFASLSTQGMLRHHCEKLGRVQELCVSRQRRRTFATPEDADGNDEVGREFGSDTVTEEAGERTPSPSPTMYTCYSVNTMPTNPSLSQQVSTNASPLSARDTSFPPDVPPHQQEVQTLIPEGVTSMPSTDLLNTPRSLLTSALPVAEEDSGTKVDATAAAEVSVGAQEEAEVAPLAQAAEPVVPQTPAKLSVCPAELIVRQRRPGLRDQRSLSPDEVWRRLRASGDPEIHRILTGVAALSGSHQWHHVKEVHGCRLDELAAPPDALLPLLHAMHPEGRHATGAVGLPSSCVALRVRAELPCSIFDAKALLSDSGAAFVLEPELTSLVEEPSPPTVAASHFVASPLRTSPVRWQRRHHLYDAMSGNRGDQPWDMVVRCAGVECAPFLGDLLGLHAPGEPAASFIWGAIDAGDQAIRDPHGRTIRVRVLAYAWTVVAVPATASSVRATLYQVLERREGTRRGWLPTCGVSALERHRSWMRLLEEGMLTRMHKYRFYISNGGCRLLGSFANSPVEGMRVRPLLSLLADMDTQIAQGSASICVVARFDLPSGVSCVIYRDGSDAAAPLQWRLSLGVACPFEHTVAFFLSAPDKVRTLNSHVCDYKVHHLSQPSMRTVAGHASMVVPGVTLYSVQHSSQSFLFPRSSLRMLEGVGFMSTGVFVLARMNVTDPLEGADGTHDRSMPATSLGIRKVHYDGYVVRMESWEDCDDVDPVQANFVSITRHLSVDLPDDVTHAITSTGELGHPYVRELVAEMTALSSCINASYPSV